MCMFTHSQATSYVVFIYMQLQKKHTNERKRDNDSNRDMNVNVTYNCNKQADQANECIEKTVIGCIVNMFRHQNILASL